MAHVYVRDPARVADVKRLLQRVGGVAEVLDAAGQRSIHIDHPRSGELVCLAERDAWFTYYFWQDDARAPDYARTVDIHRKPGYDPVELFLNPALSLPKARIGWMLAKKKMGFRTLMRVIPLDASLVKGSHGLAAARPEEGALLMTTEKHFLASDRVTATAVFELLMRHLID